MRLSNIFNNQSKAQHCADILKAVAHPIRLRIIALLVREPHHVNSLAEILGCNQSIISQQLRILRMKELVRVRRKKGFAFYELAEPGLVELVKCVEQCDHRTHEHQG